MTKLNIRLTENDIRRINKLKDKYGFTQTGELIRFLLAKDTDEIKKWNGLEFISMMI